MPSLSFNKLVPSRMSARQLTLLVQLAEKGSVLHAAEAMHMTQSAASKTLIALENTLGVPLFTRQARGIEPTAFGEILIYHARCVLTQLQLAQKELTDAQTGVVGTVSIGTSITSITELVPRAVVALKESHPGIRVILHQGYSEKLVQQLLDCELDIVVARSYTVGNLNNVNFTPICDDTCCLVVNGNHPLLRKPDLGLQDLVDQTWVMPPASTTMHRRLLSLFMEQHVSPPQSIVETSSLSTAVRLLQISHMIMPMVSGAVTTFCHGEKFTTLPLTLDFILSSPGIVTLRNRPLSPSTRIMLNALKQAANECAAPQSVQETHIKEYAE